MTDRFSRSERLVTYLLVAVAIVVFAIQLTSLFILPQPNSLRWFGDETWLMAEAKQQITTGVVRYPLALGSTLEHGKGVVLSMTWLSALLYGLPATLSTDVISVGRLVTAMLAGILLIAVYGISRSIGASRFAASVAILLLVTTRAFLFSSHSARPDLLAGLIVVAFVGYCTRLSQDPSRRSALWWFLFGAIVTFLALSSSIHLLTLLGPIALFFTWRLGAFRSWATALSAISGAMLMLAILILAYTVANPTLELFSSGSGSSQFQDVLHSIPILRPLSRSVQVSNIVIRGKQIFAESPQVLLVFVLVPFVPRSFWRSSRTFTIATIIVFFSWLLLQGAEINYLIHILPLLFVAIALLLSSVEYSAVRWLAMAACIAFAALAVRDAVVGKELATKIDRSNRDAVYNIERAIAYNWPHQSKPRVVTEPPALARLSQDTNILTITDHFISFPVATEPLSWFFARENIDYIVLYNSPTYPKDRPNNDPFYQEVRRNGRLMRTEIGSIGDIGRNYFQPSKWEDTLLLFQVRK